MIFYRAKLQKDSRLSPHLPCLLPRLKEAAWPELTVVVSARQGPRCKEYVTPPPYLLLIWPGLQTMCPPMLFIENRTPPPGCQHPPLPPWGRRKKGQNRHGHSILPLGRCPCCLPPRLLGCRRGYGRITMPKRRDDGLFGRQ